MAREFTPKQIEKYKRQKLLGAQDKCTKNLYKLFRDETSTYIKYRNKFIELKKEIDKFSDILLTTDHSRRVNDYITRLFQATIINQIDEESYHNMKEVESSNLNRLQKSKNATKYKKDKHKDKNSW